MIAPDQLFSTDPGRITDFSGVRAADIFNRAVLPAANGLAKLLGDDPAGLDEAAAQREAQLQKEISYDVYQQQEDDNYLAQMNQGKPLEVDPEIGAGVDYNAPIEALPASASASASAGPAADTPTTSPAQGFSETKLKLSNYGYDSDSSPDYNSNILKIGHANNKLQDGLSAALTKSLAKRHGLKTGDMFEVVTADGKVLKRRYDDTVPTTYKGKKLPETVDLYEVNGSNKFGGVVVGIRPLGKKTKKLDLPDGKGDVSEYDNPILPPRT